MRVFNNPDLYPTPKEVIERMLDGFDLNGKTVLEPSAGLGDIVDYCAGSGATVLVCEIVPELREILKGKKCKIIGDDFAKVKAEHISHIDYVVMNPPFSADEGHILHAWENSPDGCVIVALCNANTVEHPRSPRARILEQVINDYGIFENWGNCFSDADRQTDVQIGFIKLVKPKGKTDDEFEGFFMDEEEEAQEVGLQQYNFVRDVVNRYVGAVKIYDTQLEAAKQMNRLTSSFFSSNIALSMTDDGAEKSREEYKKDLQKDAWKYVINKFNLEKYSTKGLQSDINKFVEQQTHIPFTMKNIYQMINIIIGTASNRMDRDLEEVFDALTNHYHENRFNVEGWKTNSHYLVNQKFILPSIFGDPYTTGTGLKISYSNRNSELFQDFMKALCFITGKDYDKLPTLYQFLNNENVIFDKDGKVVMEQSVHNGKYYNVVGFSRYGYRTDSVLKHYPESEGYEVRPRPMHGEWFDFEFFEIKGFKKGTGHFKFKDKDVWALFNQHIARIKGFPLPESIKKKKV